MSQELVIVVADMREDDAFTLAQEMAASGVDPMEIPGDAREAMDIVP